nr:hypothetical protein [Tanacetum cinerariifolium]
GSRVFNLELRDLPHKIDEAVRESRMFETGTYKSLFEHVALYEALEASMKSANRDELFTKMKKSFKRQGDDQDPPSPPPDSDLTTTYQAPAENSLLEKTKDMRTFMQWYCQQIGKTELTQADLEGQAYEVVKAFYPDIVHLQFQMEESHKMLTDQIDWANPHGDKSGLISANLCLSMVHQKFSIDRHIVDSSRKVVKTHIRILSVVRIKAYYRYGYDYLKEITLRKADYQEYTIAEKDF